MSCVAATVWRLLWVWLKLVLQWDLEHKNRVKRGVRVQHKETRMI
jgi:hypothetical protein